VSSLSDVPPGEALTFVPPRDWRARLRRLWRILRANPRLATGLAIVVVVLLLAVFAPLLARFDPQTAHPGDELLPPNATYLLGTDKSGMDIFSRLVYAPRIDLTIAVTATLLAIAIGTPIGVVAGYYTNRWSESAMRVADLIQSFPVFVLGMALVVLTGQRIENVVLAIAVVNAPVYARLVRSQAVYVKQRLFIEAAKASGSSDRGIVFGHLLPNSSGPIFAMSSVTVGTAMLLTAGLSFVGAGVRVPTPEWGSMIAVGTSSLMEGGKWWPSVFPGLMLSITVMGFGLIGDSLAEVTDPRRRRV
jgi:peptide/nickel transport system permease protein